jgi:hypothetical protein
VPETPHDVRLGGEELELELPRRAVIEHHLPLRLALSQGNPGEEQAVVRTERAIGSGTS